MQLFLDVFKPIPSDATLDPSTQKPAQLSVLLDGYRYTLVRRLGRVYSRINKNIMIDLIDC